MWSTFVMTVKVNLRNRQSLFWLIVFPIALATLFNGLFGNLAKGYEITPIPLAVVQDANWSNATAAQTFVNALSGTASPSGTADGETPDNAAGDIAALGTRLIDATTVPSTDKARAALADGTADGYLNVDGNGQLTLTLASALAGDPGSNGAITIAALDSAINLYNRTDAATRDLIARNPQAATSRAFWSSLGDIAGTTHEIQLTNFKPDAMARYYYALLGMACLMAMGYAVTTVTTAQANLSALGVRRTVAPLGRIRQLMAGFLASWLCSGLSLLIALAYIRYVCGIVLGGREPVAALAVAVASFMACAFGTMIGAIPRLSHGVKIGLTSAIPCALSLFSGLYGGFAMELSDWIARNAPALALVNPAQQVTNLFYDILYYDNYRPFLATCGVLLAMSAVFLAAGAAMMKEQRYEHL